VRGSVLTKERLRWAALIGSLILIANFWVLRAYGDTLQSTHLFIVRGTVFYPLSLLNLAAGIVLLLFTIGNGRTGTRK
jgi:hypothetical protein